MEQVIKIFSNDPDNVFCRTSFIVTIVMFIIGIIIQEYFPMETTITGRNVRVITAVIWGLSYFIILPVSYASIPKKYDLANIVMALLLFVLFIGIFLFGIVSVFSS